MESINRLCSNKKLLLGIYIFFALAASVQSLLIGDKTFHEGGISYPQYNNYTIFKKSFEHLIDQKDLYILYPEEHWDLFKYTPTFALFFGIFGMLPDWLGLPLWNLLNALLLFFALYSLPRISQVRKGYMALFLLIEMMTSLQNAQSNALIAGLLIGAFSMMENEKMFAAAALIAASAFIKIFGALGFVLFIFYPDKIRYAWYIALSCIALWAMPLCVTSVTHYIHLFQSYAGMLAHDHSTSYGLSVMGWFFTWFHWEINKNLVVAGGFFMLMLPLIRISQFTQFYFRYLFLTLMMIWLIIFNHKAESATFVIAVAGMALWYFYKKRNVFSAVLVVSAFVFTSLSPTDFFPIAVRTKWVIPYVLKAVPCILVWIVIWIELMTNSSKEPA